MPPILVSKRDLISNKTLEISEVCKSCGTDLKGKYCSDCGEKVVNRSEQTLRHFMTEVIGAFTFADTKVLKTLKYLFFKPGRLPELFIKGARKKFISPLPLFLFINLLYFLFSPFDTFNSFFGSQLNGQPYSHLIRDYGVQQLQASGMNQNDFTTSYNAQSVTLSKSIILLMPILLSFPLWLLFYRRSSYFFDHLMFAINFMSFTLLGVFFIIPILLKGLLKSLQIFDLQVDFDWNGDISIGIILTVLITYLAISIRSFYRQTFVLTGLKTILVLISFIGIMFLYRFILFFLTLWLM